MKTKDKSKKQKKNSSSKNGKKSGKAQRAKERAAKREARKGDGSFPDVLLVTKEKSSTGDGKYFFGHHENGDSLYKNDQTVAVYKLRRVSKMVINRKVAR